MSERSLIPGWVMMLIGLEPFVVGYFVAWAARKARRAGDRVDGKIDDVLDTSVDRLAALLMDKLGTEPAIEQIQDEAACGVDNERTRLRAQLAIEDATERDEQFSNALRSLVEQIRAREGGATPTTSVEIKATASGNARIPIVGSGTMTNVENVWERGSQ
jgi:hypothetical protein